MAAFAGIVEHLAMQRDPVGALMAGWLNALAELKIGRRAARRGNHRNGMAQVAFQADGSRVLSGNLRQMLAVMAAETTC